MRYCWLVSFILIIGCHPRSGYHRASSIENNKEYQKVSNMPSGVEAHPEYQKGLQKVLSVSTSANMTSLLSALFNIGYITGMSDADYCLQLTEANAKTSAKNIIITQKLPSEERF